MLGNKRSHRNEKRLRWNEEQKSVLSNKDPAQPKFNYKNLI